MIRKLQLAAAVIAIALLISMPMVVLATHGFGSGPFTVMVDDELFELWGFGGDGPVPAFRLQDIAYMLNGTAAQFDLRTPPDGRWDYWIVRGAPYTPQGTELSLDFEERYAVYGSYGFVSGGLGFYSDPIRTVIVGLDGDSVPATTIALTVIEDPDGFFFEMQQLAPLLGIYWDWAAIFASWPYADLALTTGTIIPHEPPVQPPELVDVLLRLSGHWVDRAHFYSPVIDESVVWPAGFNVSTAGFTDVGATVAPIAMPQGAVLWYPVVMHSLENGYVELMVDTTALPRSSWYRYAIFDPDVNYEIPDDAARFYNHRIVFDASREHINEVTYYIGEARFTMMRNNWPFVFGHTDPRRYTVGPAEGDGIVLRYVLGSIFMTDDRDFRIYRSTAYGERGELVERRQTIDTHDRLLFEFVDATVEYGQVYYYSVYSFSERWGHFMISSVEGFGRQFVADVNAVLGLPPGFTGVEDEDTDGADDTAEDLESYDEPPEDGEPEVAAAAVILQPDGTEAPAAVRYWILLSSVLIIALLMFLLLWIRKRPR